MKFLSGKKTYIAAAIGVILTGLCAMGYIDQKTFEILASLSGFLGLGFARGAIAKNGYDK
jgi:hypothetical protein